MYTEVCLSRGGTPHCLPEVGVIPCTWAFNMCVVNITYKNLALVYDITDY